VEVVATLGENQLYGIAGVTFGLLVMVFCRPIAEGMNAIEKAEASFQESLTPKRLRSVASVWYRSGTDDTPGWRFLRAYIAFVVGLLIFCVGLAALVGAWGTG